MAPSGPNGRNTRSAVRAATSGSGGGAGKPRPPPKVDRNGDIDMDAGLPKVPRTSGGGIGRKGAAQKPAAKGKKKGKGSTTEQRVRRHLGVSGEASLETRIAELPRKKAASMAGRRVFVVTGLRDSKAAANSDRGEKSALEFIERKSAKMGGSGGIRVIKSRIDPDYTLHVVVSQDDADELLKLNGFVFAGAKLTVAENPGGWPGQAPAAEKPKLSAEALERKAQLQQVLGARYDPATQLLNLSHLGEDPVLIGMGYLQDKERAEKTFRVLMAICDETFPTAEAKRQSVVSVSLANNNIDYVGQVYVLAETFPDIRNLDLSGNAFRQLKSLNRWRGRFPHLETLLMTGNPVETEDPALQPELMAWFPRLQNLSGVVVRTPEQIAAEAAARAAARPHPIPQFGNDFRDVSGIAESFLSQFFALYDADRAQAANMFYDEHSQFSLSVTTQTPRSDTFGDKTPVLPWAAYLRYSRNLTKITSRSARVQRLVRGGPMIRELWATLPRTHHPALATELHKYILDCHPLSGIADPTGAAPTGVDGLLITMHGEFDEIDPTTGKPGTRSFTRTFVLGPAMPGAPAVFRVVSDMLSLRAHQALPGQQAVSTQPAPVAAQAVQAAPMQPPAAVAPQEQQVAMVRELSKVTNMTLPYSEMCLQEVGWNYDAALLKFQELRPSLGPEVFLS